MEQVFALYPPSAIAFMHDLLPSLDALGREVGVRIRTERDKRSGPYGTEGIVEYVQQEVAASKIIVVVVTDHFFFSSTMGYGLEGVDLGNKANKIFVDLTSDLDARWENDESANNKARILTATLAEVRRKISALLAGDRLDDGNERFVLDLTEEARERLQQLTLEEVGSKLASLLEKSQRNLPAEG